MLRLRSAIVALGLAAISLSSVATQAKTVVESYVATTSSTHAFWLPRNSAQFPSGPYFKFIDDNTSPLPRFNIFDDGTAELVGKIVDRNENSPGHIWEVQMDFLVGVDYNTHIANGGKVKTEGGYGTGGSKGDKTTWTYYELDEPGTLTGIGADNNGESVDIYTFNPKLILQVGMGGSLKNSDLGASIWIDTDDPAYQWSPHGDININLNFIPQPPPPVIPAPSPAIATAFLGAMTLIRRRR